ncbi:MAG: TadE family protein, partial [Bdellovibrionota bacterium]
MVRHQGRMQAGSVIVEAAIVLPMILIVLLLLFDFSLTLSDRITLTEAARHGARVGSGLSLGSGKCLDQISDTALEAAGTFLENSGTLNAEDVFRGRKIATLTLNSNCDASEGQTISYIEVATEKVGGRPSVFK